MKIVIIGGTGRIGSKLGRLLRDAGHEVVPASPDTGVNTITGEGLADVLQGASVVVDVSNSPSFEDQPVMRFFETSTKNIIAAEKAAKVSRHVILSIVGADRMPDSGYMRAKLVQENLLKDSGIPYSILRATQFFEFVPAIAESGASGDAVRVASALFQPVAADDVASELAKIVPGQPLNATTEVAGPDRAPLSTFVQRVLIAKGDPRNVTADPQMPYFGQVLDEKSLVPEGHPRIGALHFEDWLASALATSGGAR
jgi:uncharacterized protein YbjT (DUF2867 family)